MRRRLLWSVFSGSLLFAAVGCGQPAHNSGADPNMAPAQNQPATNPASSSTTPYPQTPSSMSSPAPTTPAPETTPAGTQSTSPNPPVGDPQAAQAENTAATNPPQPDQPLTRDQFMQKVQKDLDTVHDEIAALATKVDAGTDAIKTRYETRWKQELQTKQAQLQAMLDKARDLSEAEWARMKSNLQTAMTDLKKAYDDSVKDLQSGT